MNRKNISTLNATRAVCKSVIFFPGAINWFVKRRLFPIGCEKYFEIETQLLDDSISVGERVSNSRNFFMLFLLIFFFSNLA